MKTVGCIIARTSSKRLPGKALLKIKEKNLMEYLIGKIRNSKYINSLYICTSNMPEDKVLLDVSRKLGIKSYAGSIESVIDRLLSVAEIEKADSLVRITGDNIFTDETFIDRMIEYKNNNPVVDYIRTEYLPLGVTSEVISVGALRRCRTLVDPKTTQYLMWQMFNPDIFNCAVLLPPPSIRREYNNLSIDPKNDIGRKTFILENVNKKGWVSYIDILNLDKKQPIPFFEISEDFSIKVSESLKITFQEYRNLMGEKIRKSAQFSA